MLVSSARLLWARQGPVAASPKVKGISGGHVPTRALVCQPAPPGASHCPPLGTALGALRECEPGFPCAIRQCRQDTAPLQPRGRDLPPCPASGAPPASLQPCRPHSAPWLVPVSASSSETGLCVHWSVPLPGYPSTARSISPTLQLGGGCLHRPPPPRASARAECHSLAPPPRSKQGWGPQVASLTGLLCPSSLPSTAVLQISGWGGVTQADTLGSRGLPSSEHLVMGAKSGPVNYSEIPDTSLSREPAVRG